MTAPATGIPIESAIRYGWETFKKNAELILAIEGAAIVTVVVLEGASNLLDRYGWFHEFAMSVAYFVVTSIIQLGVARVSLAYRDGKKVEFANMFDRFGILPAFMAAAVLNDFAVGLGLIFLLVPGIIIAVRFCLFGFLIVDENRGPVEAIQRSIQLTRGSGLDLFFFGVLCVVLNILGFFALVIGSLVTMPVTALAAGYVYRHLNPAPDPDASP